ncbi:cobyrinate a,c-diamide synthase [Nakamurella flava]|uniref:Hydrogenobyrinate a,c-diamide synthase n=1 Tax=Nakamurella flava TaxID=2576308 RepID=A0A4U6QFC1_9ACTN|nr:cobyrinate a,c-diamide synthase [Nakamurella flava]
MTLPRVVIAAPSSGSGKTTVATGLMAALRRRGLEVSGHKVGPDYIDPGYHALATGRPGRNLDAHLVGVDRLPGLLAHGALVPRPADVAVIEGVMGLYDGALGQQGFASTAHVAAVVAAPVLLVVDASGAARTHAAVVHGLASFDRSVRIGGVILNRVGSERHGREITDALEDTGLPVLGSLPRDPDIAAPSRHLGLVPVAERPEAVAALDRLADHIAATVDLDGVLALARTAPPLLDGAWDAAAEIGYRSPQRRVVAVAGGRAFTFRYAETDELLRAAGLDPVVFDPLADHRLPEGTAGLYLGGGFPEVHAGELAANDDLRRDIRAHLAAGLPTVAECAGLLYLSRTLDGLPGLGVVAADAAMTPRLTLGYRSAVAPVDSVYGPAGTRVTGHEFHRTATDPGWSDPPAWLVGGRPEGFVLDPSGTGRPTVHASYLHVHWAGHPEVAAGFARAVAGWQPAEGALLTPVADSAAPVAEAVVASSESEPDLHHHGDRDIADGLVDLAVNVRLPRPPDWLADEIRRAVDDLARYPDATPARAALAARHARDEAEVLPTAGGAEAFTLLARAVRPRRAVVVHPQFTEPEAALRAAGHSVDRLLLRAEDDFALDPAQVPADADLVMLGNPTNPTGRLHPAATIRALLRPGRLVVVDEAFMDAVPAEQQLRESLVGEGIPGLLILRSMTKTWGLAGLRAGYAVGETHVIAELAAQQPPWSMSSLAVAATVACCSERADEEAATAAETFVQWRRPLIEGLTDLGLAPVPGSVAPFVLVDTATAVPPDGAPGALRLALRERGFAVRRGDTFPGLGPGWIRLAVRPPDVTAALLVALQDVLRTWR